MYNCFIICFLVADKTVCLPGKLLFPSDNPDGKRCKYTSEIENRMRSCEHFVI